MQVVINFVIAVKPSNTFQYLPIPNLQNAKYKIKTKD